MVWKWWGQVIPDSASLTLLLPCSRNTAAGGASLKAKDIILETVSFSSLSPLSSPSEPDERSRLERAS